MIINKSPVIGSGGIVFNRQNPDEDSQPRTGHFHPVYRVYIGNKLVYPDKFPGAINVLDVPYKIVVQYQYIEDGRNVLPNWTGAYLRTRTTTITIETAFPCFVHKQEHFSDFSEFMNPSELPYMNVSDALAIVFPNVARGSSRDYYGSSDRWHRYSEIMNAPASISGFPFAYRPSEADTIFIYKKEEVEVITYNQEGVPASPVYYKDEQFHYFTPSTYAIPGRAYVWGGAYTQYTNKINSFSIERYITVESSASHIITFERSPTTMLASSLIDSDSQLGIGFTGPETSSVSDGVNTYGLNPNEVVSFYRPLPEKFIFTSTGTQSFTIYAKRIYGPYYREINKRIAPTTDERILRRLASYPDAHEYPFSNNFHQNNRGISRNQTTGGLYGNLNEVWPTDWDVYSYPLIPLQAGADRAFSPARYFAIRNQFIPFYEIYNGRVVTPGSTGTIDIKHDNTYQILENNNPAYSSYSEWLADVTTPGHDPKPPVTS